MGLFVRGEGRSAQANASDAYQEQLIVQRQRTFGLLFLALIIVEAALWYSQSDTWLLLVVPVAWLGILIHNNALLILHELWEMNDQLAGRKDEFSRIVRMKH
jgi:hypothetical protein